MKVLLVNGSPHTHGCTYTALDEVSKILTGEGIETEIFQVGIEPIRGCTDCDACIKAGRCVFPDGRVGDLVEKAAESDGFVFGTPVHYASAAGALVSLLDRAFYSQSNVFAYKPGAAVASARRAGTTAALEVLNKYFTIKNMPIVSSQYWNMVHGNTPEEVKQDLEGLQIMRTLGRNMAWLLKCIEAGKALGIVPVCPEEQQVTNFIH